MLGWLQEQLHNPIFSGAAGFSIIGGAVYFLRQLPGQIAYALVKWFSHSVTVTNQTDVYEHLLRWLGPKLDGWHVRSFSLTMKSDDLEARNERWSLAPGFGGFWMRWNGWPYHVTREMLQQTTGRARTQEQLTIRCPGLGRARIDALIKAAERDVLNLESIRVFQHHGYWQLVDTVVPRKVETVALPNGVMANLLGDVQRFLASADRYRGRGIPYRRGYLFEGPPGTGKSSTALAVAGHFGMSIYVLNLSSMGGDNELFGAFAQVPRGAMILIEDVDAAGVTATRAKTPHPNGDEATSDDHGITLSGLLNVIDGIVAKEGRILVMTSNHPEKLDAALARPGRVDKVIRFDVADDDQAEAIFRRFFGADADLVGYPGSMTPAAIQAACLCHEDDPEAALAKLAVAP